MEKNAEDVGEQLGPGESGAEASATADGQGESGGVADHCEVDVDVAGPEENQPMLGPAKPNPRNYDRSDGASLSDAFYAVFLCIAVTYILIYLKEIIIPLVVAVFFLYLFRPVADFTEKRLRDVGRKLCCSCCSPADDKAAAAEGEEETGRGRGRCCRKRICAGINCSRIAAMVLCLVLSLIVMALVAVVISSSIETLQSQGKLQQYRHQLDVLQNSTADFLTRHLQVNGQELAGKFFSGDVVGSFMADLLGFTASFLSGMLLVLVFLAFLLVEDSLSGAHRSDKSPTIRSRINRTVRAYIALKTLICTGASLLVWVALAAMQFPLSGLIALLSFVLNYIPNLGPIIATLLPVPVLLLDTDLASEQKVLSMIIPSLIHTVVGNCVEPLLFYSDEEIRLHPITLICALVLWYIIWGVPGAVFAVPITTSIRIVAKVIVAEYPGKSPMAAAVFSLLNDPLRL